MPRQPGVHFDKRAGCWATSSLGEMRFTATGRGYRPKTYNRGLTHPTKDRQAARDWISAKLREKGEGAKVAGDPDLYQLAEWHLHDVEKVLSPKAYLVRAESLCRCLDWPGRDHPQRIGKIPAKKVCREDIRPFLAAMTELGRSDFYVRYSLLSAIKRLLSWATEVEPGRFPGLPLASSPLARIKWDSTPVRSRREVDPKVVGRFVRWAWREAMGRGPKVRRFAQIQVILLQAMRETGARPKELLVAEWSEYRRFDDGWGLITLPAWKWKNGKKTKKERLIAIPPAVARRIEWIRSHPGHHPDRIFCRRPGKDSEARGVDWDAGEPWVWIDPKTKRSGPSDSFQECFLRLRKRASLAGVPMPEGFRLYFFRSSYSTESQRRGVSRAELADSMGTSEAMLAKHYSDHDERDIMATAKRAREGRA